MAGDPLGRGADPAVAYTSPQCPKYRASLSHRKQRLDQRSVLWRNKHDPLTSAITGSQEQRDEGALLLAVPALMALLGIFNAKFLAAKFLHAGQALLYRGVLLLGMLEPPVCASCGPKLPLHFYNCFKNLR